jgi:glutathione S-transferase
MASGVFAGEHARWLPGDTRMLTLFDYLPSQNGWKVRQLLAHLGLPHRTEFVSIFEGAGQDPGYLAINPMGAVPAIRLDDGRVLAESNAILWYLAEGSAYLPAERFARAKVAQWLSFEADYVQSSIGTLRHWVLTGKASRRPPELVAGKQSASLKALRILDRDLARREFVAGDTYGIADISVYAYAQLAPEAGVPLAGFPHFRAWCERVRAQPGHLATMHPYSVDPHSGRELPG